MLLDAEKAKARRGPITVSTDLRKSVRIFIINVYICFQIKVYFKDGLDNLLFFFQFPGNFLGACAFDVRFGSGQFLRSLRLRRSFWRKSVNTSGYIYPRSASESCSRNAKARRQKRRSKTEWTRKLPCKIPTWYQQMLWNRYAWLTETDVELLNKKMAAWSFVRARIN